jgi:hypothetical protein
VPYFGVQNHEGKGKRGRPGQLQLPVNSKNYKTAAILGVGQDFLGWSLGIPHLPARSGRVLLVKPKQISIGLSSRVISFSRILLISSLKSRSPLSRLGRLQRLWLGTNPLPMPTVLSPTAACSIAQIPPRDLRSLGLTSSRHQSRSSVESTTPHPRCIPNNIFRFFPEAQIIPSVDHKRCTAK